MPEKLKTKHRIDHKRPEEHEFHKGQPTWSDETSAVNFIELGLESEDRDLIYRVVEVKENIIYHSDRNDI
jgi:hypothetical protein